MTLIYDYSEAVKMEPGLQIYQHKRVAKAIASLRTARNYYERAASARLQKKWEIADRHDARADKAWNEAMKVLEAFAEIDEGPRVSPETSP